jgi:hypothetical protein
MSEHRDDGWPHDEDRRPGNPDNMRGAARYRPGRTDDSSATDRLGWPAEHGAMPVIDFPTGRITDWETFHDVFRCPELYDATLDGAAFVNYARIEAGDRPIVAVSAFRHVVTAGLTAGPRRFHVKTRLPTSLRAYRRPEARA